MSRYLLMKHAFVDPVGQSLGIELAKKSTLAFAKKLTHHNFPKVDIESACANQFGLA